MKKIITTTVAVFLMTGCATIQPRFEDSNQFLLERTIDELKVGDAIRNEIPKGKTVALVSLETNGTPKPPVVAILEDQIIRSLVTNGYIVMERDATNVINLIREGDNFSMAFPYSPNVIEVENANGGSLKPGIHLQKTSLKAADYLISYRVLEAGIIYRQKGPEQTRSPGKKTRESLVRVHLRVANTNSGEISYAENLTGTITDQIPDSFIYPLASFHYSFFPYEYPVRGRGLESTVINVDPAADPSSNRLVKQIMWGIGVSVALLVMAEEF